VEILKQGNSLLNYLMQELDGAKGIQVRLLPSRMGIFVAKLAKFIRGLGRVIGEELGLS